MSHINVKGLVENISQKTTIYSPIVEAIVNSIDSIESGKITDGIINITLKREDQIPLGLEEDTLPRIKSIEIQDNGIGFNTKNRESFDTLYSSQKASSGGKGFGRFIFLKYFSEVNIESTFEENDSFYKRRFSFYEQDGSVDSLVTKENLNKISTSTRKTIVHLNDIKEEHLNKLDKKLETIARNLVEKLLPYFIDDKYLCPTITLQESNSEEKIVLNSFFKNHDGIKLVTEKDFALKSNDSKEQSFELKIFKVYSKQGSSSIILTAHNRAVTSEPIHDYIPEFRDEFFDEIKSAEDKTVTKNYVVKAYILGDYLNKHVSAERYDFDFPKEISLEFPFSRKDVELEAIHLIREAFSEDVNSRLKIKKDKIKEYVDTQAPWHKSYFNDLDLTNVPYNFEPEVIESELQKLRFDKEQSFRKQAVTILENGQDEETAKKIEEISKGLTEIGKSELAHYVVIRKVVLDLLNKSLGWDASKKYEKEQTIHDVIFPLRTDSDHLPYDNHNLWIIDERLSFSEFISSDNPINETDLERPDLVIFSKSIAVRDGDELSNPVTIIEFKRPQRENYKDDEDPINQILRYIEKIRKGNVKDIGGRKIEVTGATPAYGFVICDLNDKIDRFCKQHSLVRSPDQQGYYGFNSGYDIYLEVISYKKLIKDAELRNKIFFKKLGLI